MFKIKRVGFVFMDFIIVCEEVCRVLNINCMVIFNYSLKFFRILCVGMYSGVFVMKG